MLQFDIMIVYEGTLAHSAADPTYTESTPFAHDSPYANCNATYQYFIEYCKTQGIRAAFATTHDITGTGTFKSVWTYSTAWERQIKPSHCGVIFDKFSHLLPRNHEPYRLLNAGPEAVHLFHHASLRTLFDDKLATYQAFPDYAIPTVPVGEPNDFGRVTILKDRFGIGGNNIFKITNRKQLNQILADHPNTEFVVQPFIQADGFKIAGHTGNTDLRVIISDYTIVQSYLRIARPGEFRANAQQGGELVYLSLKQIPPDVLGLVAKITQQLPVDSPLYTLDFIKSHAGRLYFIEGNASPGLNWFNPEDERYAKELIRHVVKDLQHYIPGGK